jgi:hypothetical protein
MATLSLGANLAVHALAGAAAGDAAALAAAETAAAAASAAAATAQSDAAAALEAEADDDAHAHLSSADDEANEVTMASALAAVELAEGMARGGRGGLADLADLTVAGREHFLDPRLANTIKLRMALLPSAGLYASALGLAHAVDFCARVHVQALHARMAGVAAWARARTAAATGAGGEDAARVAFSCPPPQPARAAAAGSSARPLAELVDLRAVWAAHYTGLRLFGFRRGGGDGEAGPHDHVSAFGVAGLGGTLALHDLPSGVSIAITVNQLAADASVARHLLHLVCAELGLGVPREADL